MSKSLEQTKAGLRVKSTKSEKPRHFSVPETALLALADHRKEQENDKRLFGSDYQDHDLIFCQPGGGYYSPDRLGARVKELMVAVGLKGVSSRWATSRMLRNGVPLAEVSRRLGHADQNITLAIYNHAVPADSRAAARVWDDALGDVIQEGKKAVEELPVAHGCTEGTEKEAFVAKENRLDGGDDGARTRDLRRDRPAF